MKGLCFSFHNIKLGNKILAMYFLAVFVPIILTNVLFYRVTISNVKDQQIADANLALQQINNSMENLIEDAAGISSIFFTNLNVNEFLERNYKNDIEYMESYEQFIRTLNQTSPMNPSINSVHFYTNNPTMIYSGGVYPLPDTFNEALNSKDSAPILKASQAFNGMNTFSLVRKLDYFNIYKKPKLVEIQLNPTAIKDIFDNNTYKWEVHLVNDKGEIVYSTNPLFRNQDNPPLFRKVESSSEVITLTRAFKNDFYLKNWKVVGVVSKEQMLTSIYKSRQFIVYLALINLVIPTFIIIFITRSFLSRLKIVLKHVTKMKDQDFELIKDENYMDEIGLLTSEFNRMTKIIKDLINDVLLVNIQKQDLEIKRNRAQLSALQSQINPHFLFNALETIRMRSLMKDEVETAKIIQNMAKIFRNSITWGKDLVPVKDEVSLIKSFLEIQKYRFGDKLCYEIDVDKSAEDILIPNMALLPFVENASIHGIEQLKGDGYININILRVADRVICTVTDNGIGLTEDRRMELLDSLNGEEIGSNVGIKNVYYRLKLYYNTQFHFEIESQRDKGTTIRIEMPIQKEISSTNLQNLYFIK